MDKYSVVSIHKYIQMYEVYTKSYSKKDISGVKKKINFEKPNLLIEQRFAVLKEFNEKDFIIFLDSIKVRYEECIIEKQYFRYNKMSSDISVYYNQKEYVLDMNFTGENNERYVFKNITKKKFFNIAKEILIEKGYECDYPFRDCLKITSESKIYTIKFENEILEVILDNNVYTHPLYSDIQEKIFTIKLKLKSRGKNRETIIYKLIKIFEGITEYFYDWTLSEYLRAKDEFDIQSTIVVASIEDTIDYDKEI